MSQQSEEEARRQAGRLRRQQKLAEAHKVYLKVLATPEAEARMAEYVKRAQEGIEPTIRALRRGEQPSLANRSIVINASPL